MSIGIILLIILFVLALGAAPTWEYSRGWGYLPSGLFGVLFVIVLAFFLTH